MKMYFLLVLLLSLPARPDSSDAAFQVSVLSPSRVAIEGSSTVNRFACEAEAVRGSGSFADGRAEAHVTVPTAAFDCGKERMNRDLREAMKAELHPEVHFELIGYGPAVPIASNQDRLLVEGRLTIAGVTRTVEIDAVAERQANGTYRLRGHKRLRMSDFGIDPPTALAGLIRTHDQIAVRFDLLATTKGRLGFIRRPNGSTGT